MLMFLRYFASIYEAQTNLLPVSRSNNLGTPRDSYINTLKPLISDEAIQKQFDLKNRT